LQFDLPQLGAICNARNAVAETIAGGGHNRSISMSRTPQPIARARRRHRATPEHRLLSLFTVSVRQVVSRMTRPAKDDEIASKLRTQALVGVVMDL
jgi:hypothetical protein